MKGLRKAGRKDCRWLMGRDKEGRVEKGKENGGELEDGGKDRRGCWWLIDRVRKEGFKKVKK